MITTKKEYQYTGPVMEFDRCIERDWKASTLAVSPKKALSNLVYRYKMEHNRDRSSKIVLAGKLTERKEGE